MKERTPNNQEGSRSPENRNSPEKPSNERSWRGMGWMILGGAIAGGAHLTGDDTFRTVGITIGTLGLAEFGWGMLDWNTRNRK